MKTNEIVKKIARHIVSKVQNESTLTGFQLIVGFEEVEKEFNISMTEDMAKDIAKDIEMELGCCEEVADVLMDEYGFDVILCTAYAPNYAEEDYEE